MSEWTPPAWSRREFVAALGALAAGASAGPVFAGEARVTFGCAAITWGERYLQAIDDVGKAGYRGIQLRANVVPPHKDHPTPLRARLEKNGLGLACLSSGNVALDGDPEAEIGRHLGHARFVKALGGSHLQLLDDQRSTDPAQAGGRIAELGRRMGEIGRRAGDLGVTVVYHNHMGSLSQAPEELVRVLDAAPADHVRLLLDVAHYQQGGGDPAAGLRKHAGRLGMVHLKDVRPAAAGSPHPYQWVELGQGTVDFPAVFKALDDVDFAGWGIVELDAVPVPGRTELESALMSRHYLEDTLRRRV